MSLLLRKNAKAAAKTNDFSKLTWKDLEVRLEQAESLIGKNAQLRYGIATETDVGLPENKHILIPVLESWDTSAELENMYTQEVLMSGIHMVTGSKGEPIVDHFPTSGDLAKVAEVEWQNRTDLRKVDCYDECGFGLEEGRSPKLLTELTMVATHLNYTQFKAEYGDMPEGTIIAGAHAVGMAYRTGIIESHATREFQFIQVELTDGGGYRIIRADPKYIARKNAVLKEGQEFPPGTLRMHEKLMELGLGICIGSGTTHYMMNHTTGGNRLNGHNLKALAINSLYTVDPERDMPNEERQTSFFYNVCHPVNKRAVASIVLENSRVNSWYKNARFPSPSVMYSDTFMTYRQRLIPSGAHKVYIAAMVLKDIVAAGLGVFLPDPEIGKKVVRLYGEVKKFGARAHVGSRYYTDEPIAVTQGEVDDFLPIAAFYVQHKMATSSLAASPHLDPITADSADPRWKEIIIATLRVSGISAPMEQITAYLKASGAAGFRVRLDSEEGRIQAIEDNNLLLGEITALFM